MIEHVRRYVLPAAYSLLPAAMASTPASNLLIAIGWQESRFAHRRQIVQSGSATGPARGFWQFEEKGGVAGVLRHPWTEPHVRRVLEALRYHPLATAEDCHAWIEHNDVLAAVFARLLLWTVIEPLPKVTQQKEAWRQYAFAWRPGKPHPETWDEAWGVAHAVAVESDRPDSPSLA